MKQIYIIMNYESFQEYGKVLFPDAVIVGDYRIAPFIDTDLSEVQAYWVSFDIVSEVILSSEELTLLMEEGSLIVGITPITYAREVVNYFKTEELV